MPATTTPAAPPPPAVGGRSALTLPVVSEIEEAICALEGIARPHNAGLCLYYAHATAEVLYRHGLRPVIQAGSMQWPRVRREEDDAKIDTHFAYWWSPDSLASQLAMAQGALPEMHVWAGIVETQELIDFSTRHFREHAEACGLRWTAPEPPPFLCTDAQHWPDWVVYTPNRDATFHACRILQSLFHPDYLRI